MNLTFFWGPPSGPLGPIFRFKKERRKKKVLRISGFGEKDDHVSGGPSGTQNQKRGPPSVWAEIIFKIKANFWCTTLLQPNMSYILKIIQTNFKERTTFLSMTATLQTGGDVLRWRGVICSFDLLDLWPEYYQCPWRKH